MTCPICSEPETQRYRPFCSKRCADVDLGKWMRGDYAVASENPPDREDLGETLRTALGSDRKPH